MDLLSATTAYVATLNFLYAGCILPHGSRWGEGPATEAQEKALTLAYQRCLILCRERRGLGLTGAQAAHQLLKISSTESYQPSTTVPQVPFIADRISEPTVSSPIVNMLEALPEDEATFYASEENVLTSDTICEPLLRDLEHVYGFLGGRYEEWTRYLLREDMPRDMWRFVLPSQAKARAGISAVRKKNPTQLRKLVMARPANYL